MIIEEKTISSKTIFEGRIIKLRVDSVEMPSGTETREIVEHPGGVGVVAIDENDEIILVSQYRKPFEKAIYEIPAGKLDKGEEHKVCAMRELEEETGMVAENLEYLGYIYPSPGFTDEVTHIYLATNLKQGMAHPDDDEFLDILKVPFKKAYEMVMNNEINDAKSVFGILKYMQKR